MWVRKIKNDNVELSVYKIGSILYKKYANFEVRRKSMYKSEILFKNFNDANKLLTDKSLANHNLECFLPDHRRQRKGIVRYIDTDISEQEIMTSCKSKAKVIDVKRLNRRNQ